MKSKFFIVSQDHKNVIRGDWNNNFITFGLEKVKRVVEDFSFAEKRANANEVVKS